MADRYLHFFLSFLTLHLDFPIITWLLLFTSHSLPCLMTKKPKNKPRPPKNPFHPRRMPSPPPTPTPSSPLLPGPEALANTPSSPQPSLTSAATDNLPKGNRKNKGSEEGEKTNDVVPNSGLQVPGAPLQSDDEKSSLKIKIHLNIHAKVRLDLDAQVYGDVVIGLL